MGWPTAAPSRYCVQHSHNWEIRDCTMSHSYTSYASDPLYVVRDRTMSVKAELMHAPTAVLGVQAVAVG